MKGLRYLLALTAVAIIAALLAPAMPQPVAYHDFADRRSFLGVANFLDVSSNIAFLLAGIAGLAAVFRRREAFELSAERWPYAVFFIGVLLTGLGSAYYHLAADNDRLFWDRLPMAVAFMSLVAAQIVDRADVRAGLALLVPLLLAGVVTVLYWRASERTGAGNVMPYAILQGYSVVILLLLALQPSRYTHGKDLYWIFVAYLGAKLLEHFDREILAFGNVVSGHTLKHLAAAAAAALVCRTLLLRDVIATPREAGAGSSSGGASAAPA
jgi:Ceramidase